MTRLTLATCLAVLVCVPLLGQRASSPPAASTNPTIVMETAKGTIEIQLFASEAPKSVEHIVRLVRRNFYRALRIHRVTASLVQFGDPGTRDMSRQPSWGTGNSGNPIGVAEIPKARTHRRGAVGLAHGGSAAYADSQIYIMKAASPGLNGKHAVIGQVVKGLDVVDRLVVTDLIKNITIQAAAQPNR